MLKNLDFIISIACGGSLLCGYMIGHNIGMARGMREGLIRGRILGANRARR
jgi:hypothetical protein